MRPVFTEAQPVISCFSPNTVKALFYSNHPPIRKKYKVPEIESLGRRNVLESQTVLLSLGLLELNGFLIVPLHYS